MKQNVFDDLKIFVIHHVYGDLQSSSLGSAREAKWKRQKKKSFMRLPPDDDSLKQHIMRADFLAYIQRHPELKQHPSPIGHGWELVNGCCKPVRFTKPALPPALGVPILPKPAATDSASEAESNNSDDEDSESDIFSD